MLKRSVVIRRTSCQWRPQKKSKIKTQGKTISASGFVSPITVAAIFAIFSGLLYIHSVNKSAVKGYEIRSVENEISQMKNENELLKIKEAQLRSFYKIEETSKNLNMQEIGDVTYVDNSNSLAINAGFKDGGSK